MTDQEYFFQMGMSKETFPAIHSFRVDSPTSLDGVLVLCIRLKDLRVVP